MDFLYHCVQSHSFMIKGTKAVKFLKKGIIIEENVLLHESCFIIHKIPQLGVLSPT